MLTKLIILANSISKTTVVCTIHKENAIFGFLNLLLWFAAYFAAKSPYWISEVNLKWQMQAQMNRTNWSCHETYVKVIKPVSSFFIRLITANNRQKVKKSWQAAQNMHAITTSAPLLCSMWWILFNLSSSFSKSRSIKSSLLRQSMKARE